MGDPQPSYGASRYLEVLLRERFPTEKFEVVNLGITAINSHVILPIAQECAARRDADFWIVYMGNNEMVGPFGAATVFGSRAPPLWVVRANLAAQQLRLGQLVAALWRKAGRKGSDNATWGGMRMFLKNQVPPGDRKRERVYGNFEQNLRDILKAGQNCGANIILSTMSVNLRDCPPFASMANSNGPAAQRFQDEYAAGLGYEKLGDNVNAEKSYAAAAQLDATFAEAHYRRAKCLDQVTNFAAAREEFQLACDNDALPFRADRRINGAIRALAKEFAGDRVVLCDAESKLAAAGPGGVAGDESFFEHVHFNFDGNYRLARNWAEQMAGKTPATNNWPSQEECERQLGLSDFNRAYVLQTVLRRMEQPPLSNQSNNPERAKKIQAEEARVQERLKQPDARAQARELFRSAIARTPEDHYLREGLGNFLESIEDNAGALEAYQAAHEMQPQDYYASLRMGHVLGVQRRAAEAMAVLTQAAKIRPTLPEAWFELGSVQTMMGDQEAAIKSFERARQFRPQDPSYLYYIAYCQGKVLGKQNRHAEAMEQFRKAIEILPTQWEAHFELGGELDAANQLEAARKEFGEAARLNAGYSRTHLNYGVLLAKLSRWEEAQHEFEETLRLEPGNTNAPAYLAKVKELKGEKP
jgi:tetratricopeptide (TPR) repeat protein